MNKVIVDWAPCGKIIPLVCSDCGMVFNTENIGHIGARTIYCGFNNTKEVMIGNGCKHRNHNYVPNEAMYKISEREEEMDRVLNNLKQVWKTNPDLSFGLILSLMEENTNTPVYALRDQDIITLTEGMDVSTYIQPADLGAMIEELKLGTVYDNADGFVGYTILLNNDTPIKDAGVLYDYTEVNYTDEIESMLINECGGFLDKLVCNDVLFATTVAADAGIIAIQKYYEEEVFESLEEE